MKRLDVQGLAFAFHPDRPVLRGISFAVAANEVVYVLGPNGCGKSTLFNCLSGVYAPQGGRVLLDGADLTHMAARRRAHYIGLVPQNHAAAFAYSARDMALMGRAPHLGLFETPGRADYEAADAALAAVGLSHLAARPFNELSGGERRLVTIARGLAQESDVLLLDEPDAYLDPKNQHLVQETIVALARQGRAFLISSHSPNNALLYGDRVLLLEAGRVVADGPPPEVLTAAMLSAAYGAEMEIIYESNNGAQRARAVLPVRAGHDGHDRR
ncbi:MAG: putative ABC transporter ATP-binding protein [Chloroflexi bacterium ADurb.Bin325]|nr:MAG: putative ABC transporter ATP-binding protein [Chloroflexi bacterium ADurb.Bin325]